MYSYSPHEASRMGCYSNITVLGDNFDYSYGYDLMVYSSPFSYCTWISSSELACPLEETYFGEEYVPFSLTVYSDNLPLIEEQYFYYDISGFYQYSNYLFIIVFLFRR